MNGVTSLKESRLSADQSEMTNQSQPQPKTQGLVATAGDILISRERIPYPGSILYGFRRTKRALESVPTVDFQRLQKFLEFLELVVLTERLIVPIPKFSRQTERILNSRGQWVNFSIFDIKGDLDFTTKQVIERLESAGILYEAVIDVGDSSADDIVARLLPSSKSLQMHFGDFLQSATEFKIYDKFAIAQAHLAIRLGVPLHLAEMAGLARVPYVLGPCEERYIHAYEQENMRMRRSLGEILLNRLNAGARKELSQLSALGVMSVFPETPIASLIVQNASSPQGMLDTAIQLRSEFASYRRHMNQMEYDLANENQPIRLRLKRLRELEQLADALWPSARTDLKTTAFGVSEAILAIPEIVTNPSLSSVKSLATKISSIPIEMLMDVYRRRKIRLLLRAKKSFLNSRDSTSKLASIFGVSDDIVRRSRLQDRRTPTPGYVAESR